MHKQEYANLKVQVSKKIRHDLKVKTIKNGTTIQAILEQAIMDYLNQKTSPWGDMASIGYV